MSRRSRRSRVRRSRSVKSWDSPVAPRESASVPRAPSYSPPLRPCHTARQTHCPRSQFPTCAAFQALSRLQPNQHPFAQFAGSFSGMREAQARGRPASPRHPVGTRVIPGPSAPQRPAVRIGFRSDGSRPHWIANSSRPARFRTTCGNRSAAPGCRQGTAQV